MVTRYKDVPDLDHVRFNKRAQEDGYRPSSADKASNQDRKWFKKHPDRDFRIRKPVQGEFPNSQLAVQDPCWTMYIIVYQAQPGARTRLPLPLLEEHASQFAEELTDEMLEDFVSTFYGEHFHNTREILKGAKKVLASETRDH